MVSQAGSGLGAGTASYLNNQLHRTEKKLADLDRSPAEKEALNALGRKEAERRAAVKALQEKVKKQDQEAAKKKNEKHKKTKTDKKSKKDKKVKKVKKVKEKTSKADKKDKKDKKHKSTSSSDSSTAVLAESSGLQIPAGKMQTMNFDMLPDNSAGTKLVTQFAMKGQKVGADMGTVIPAKESHILNVLGSKNTGKTKPIPSARIATTAAVLYDQADKEAKKKLLKDWSLDMFGQGHKDGGTQTHMRNRLETLIRLRLQSEAKGHFFRQMLLSVSENGPFGLMPE